MSAAAARPLVGRGARLGLRRRRDRARRRRRARLRGRHPRGHAHRDRRRRERHARRAHRPRDRAPAGARPEVITLDGVHPLGVQGQAARAALHARRAPARAGHGHRALPRPRVPVPQSHREAGARQDAGQLKVVRTLPDPARARRPRTALPGRADGCSCAITAPGAVGSVVPSGSRRGASRAGERHACRRARALRRPARSSVCGRWSRSSAATTASPRSARSARASSRPS